MFPEEVPETIKEPPLLMFKPSDSLIVKSFTVAPVEVLIIGALVTSGIVASSELVGTPIIPVTCCGPIGVGPSGPGG